MQVIVMIQKSDRKQIPLPIGIFWHTELVPCQWHVCRPSHANVAEVILSMIDGDHTMHTACTA